MRGVKGYSLLVIRHLVALKPANESREIGLRFEEELQSYICLPLEGSAVPLAQLHFLSAVHSRRYIQLHITLYHKHPFTTVNLQDPRFS